MLRGSQRVSIHYVLNCSTNFSLFVWDLGKSLVMEFDQKLNFKCYFLSLVLFGTGFSIIY